MIYDSQMGRGQDLERVSRKPVAPKPSEESYPAVHSHYWYRLTAEVRFCEE